MIDKKKELANTKKYPSRRLNQRERKTLETAEIFVPATAAVESWEQINTSAPTEIMEALDALALKVKELEDRIEVLEP
jgi:dGTP triphosphohydrolase